MNNDKLRKKAILIYRANRKTLVLITLITLLPLCVLTAVNYVFLKELVVLNRVISALFGVLLYPITTLGLAHVYLQTWRGNRPQLSMLAKFISTPNVLPNALALGVIRQVIVTFFSAPSYLSDIFPEQSGTKLLLVIISYGCNIISLVISVRLLLTSYLYTVNPLEKPIHHLRDSIQRMKGELWSYIWLMVSALWWRVLLLFIAFVLSISVTRARVGSPIFDILVLPIIALLIFAILGPYPQLIIAGFANERIPSDKEIRKMNAGVK